MNIVILLVFLMGCFFSTFIEKHYKLANFIWILIVPFCVIAATRNIDVPDTEIYINYYLLEDTDLSYFVDYGFEFGYQLTTKLFKLIANENHTVYFGLLTFLNSILIFIASLQLSKNLFSDDSSENRNNKFSEKTVLNSATFYTLYIAFFGFYVNFIVLRAGVAFSFLILAMSIALKTNKKIIDYIFISILILFSISFHTTGLIGIIILLTVLFTKQYSNKFYITILSIIGLFYFLNITSRLGGVVFSYISSLNTLTMLSNKLSNYGGESLFMSEGISMKFVFYWIMAIVMLFNVNGSPKFYRLYNVYIVGLLIFSLMRSVLLIERVTDYFLMFSFILFYVFISKKEDWKFWLYYVGIVLVQLVFVMRIINKNIM